jgi:SAM-dependent methyltransferase
MNLSIPTTSPRRKTQLIRKLTPGRVAKKLWRLASHKEYVSYRGMRLPPNDVRRSMSGDAFGSNEWFLHSGIVEALRLRARLGYTPGSKIVDIGSGLGRLATGLLWEFGENVNYLGLEVKRDYVEWCKKHIEAAHPSFRFVHIDVSNERYNPNGVQKGRNQIRLPTEDNSVDIVYLWGVFTNMAPEEVLIYIAEIHRILRPGGKAFLTAFVEKGVPEVSFNPPKYGPYEYDGSPLFVVRYDYEFLMSAFARHGLHVDEFRHHGGGTPYHSEIYLSKP